MTVPKRQMVLIWLLLKSIISGRQIRPELRHSPDLEVNHNECGGHRPGNTYINVLCAWHSKSAPPLWPMEPTWAYSHTASRVSHFTLAICHVPCRNKLARFPTDFVDMFYISLCQWSMIVGAVSVWCELKLGVGGGVCSTVVVPLPNC